jgi:hypothetical protein
VYDCIVSPDNNPVRSAKREEILAHLKQNHYPEDYKVLITPTLEVLPISIYKAKFS